MLSTLGLAQPSLKVITLGDIGFLYPSDALKAPADVPLVRGSVVLTLPNPKLVRSLVVRLVGDCRIEFPSGLIETTPTLERECVLINGGTRTFEKGDHTFNFEFSVPVGTPARERNPFGHVNHIVSAEAKGLGLAGSDIRASRQFAITVNKANDGDFLRFDLSAMDIIPELGPYVATFTSPHLTVGNLVSFSLKLPSVPQRLILHSISISITQSIVLTSLVDPSRPAVRPLPREINIFTLNSKHPPTHSSSPPMTRYLADIAKGENLLITHNARLPCDDIIRPTVGPLDSTSSSPVFPFVISHELGIYIKFTADGGLAKTLRIRRPIELASCRCSVQSHMLPIYEAEDSLSKDGAQTSYPVFGKCTVPCVCVSTDEVLRKLHVTDTGDVLMPPTYSYVPGAVTSGMGRHDKGNSNDGWVE